MAFIERIEWVTTGRSGAEALVTRWREKTAAAPNRPARHGGPASTVRRARPVRQLDARSVEQI